MPNNGGYVLFCYAAFFGGILVYLAYIHQISRKSRQALHKMGSKPA